MGWVVLELGEAWAEEARLETFSQEKPAVSEPSGAEPTGQAPLFLLREEPGGDEDSGPTSGGQSGAVRTSEPAADSGGEVSEAASAVPNGQPPSLEAGRSGPAEDFGGGGADPTPPSANDHPPTPSPARTAEGENSQSDRRGQDTPPSGAQQAASAAAKETPEPEQAVRGIQGPRDLLALFGMDESHFRRLTDGAPLASGEEEQVLKLLFRSVEFPLEQLERWAHRQVNLKELAGASAQKRGEVYWLSGRLEKMEICQPAPEAAERFMMDKYYCCHLLLEPSGQPAIAYVRTVPRTWLENPPASERAGLLGFFLKTTSADPARPRPMFVAHRIAWYPAGLLGDLGMDVGLLDEVVDRQTILPEERETFYQLLAAMRRAKAQEVFQAARHQAQKQGVEADSVVGLFKEPALHRGRLVLLRGAARKVVRVEVPDPDIRSRFGMDHYYEISLFTPDSEGNPLFVCVPALPPGMPTGEGIQYVEEVEVAAFFLKSWSYRVPPPDSVPPEKRSDMIVWKRQAPLLIGVRPIWYPRPQTSPHTVAAAVAGLLFVAAGVGLWWALWRAHRADREFRRRFFSQTAGQTTASILVF